MIADGLAVALGRTRKTPPQIVSGYVRDLGCALGHKSRRGVSPSARFAASCRTGASISPDTASLSWASPHPDHRSGNISFPLHSPAVVVCAHRENTQHPSDPPLDRLLPAIKADVTSNSTDPHDQHVTTTSGRAMILGRVCDTAAEPDSSGLQIHRFHWVAGPWRSNHSNR